MDDRIASVADPENPGWYILPQAANGRFSDIFGPMQVRVDSPTVARIRFVAESRHSNFSDVAHGGFLLGLIDQSYFIGPAILGVRDAIGGVTIDSATQFMIPVAVNRPAEVSIELLRETKRLLFLRGLIEQDGKVAVSFSGTLRKASPPRIGA